MNTPSIRRQELINEKRQYKKGASGKAIFGIVVSIVFIALTAFIVVVKILPSNTNLDDNIGSIELNTAKEAIKASSLPVTHADVGEVNGLVTSQTGHPVNGASIVAYKQMGLIYSADMNAGYSASVATNSQGAYSFDSLPSGVYKFTVTYPDGDVQTIDNYAVWPSTSSSYVFED